MKVLLVNGSPDREGCTYTALSIVAEELEGAGIETQIFQLGTDPIEGCRDCRACFQTGDCVVKDGNVNEFVALAKEADAFVFGSPVHFAAAGGKITSFLDRVFFSSRGKPFRLKPGAVVVSARRAGTTAALDQLSKYPAYAQMPLVTSCYWNMVHGTSPEEVRQDLEGVQTMQTLGKNMVWLLQSIEAGRAAGVEPPATERRIFTNFMR
ncbi:MAG: flavodoxin family protein [Oscillospiraceae bacterium]|nr:flavodoxin family protein [Oscillospiraceae bacterium]